MSYEKVYRPRTMGVLTEEQIDRLIENSHAPELKLDKVPVVHLVAYNLNYRWILTELDEDDEDVAYGLIDMNDNNPHVGYVRISDITELVKQKAYIFNDYGFSTRHCLGTFSVMAEEAKRIVASENGFEREFRTAALKYQNS